MPPVVIARSPALIEPNTHPSNDLGQSAPRKRNRIACQQCHQRKVSVLSRPCTNCRLDQRPCFVRDVPRSRRKKVCNNSFRRSDKAPSQTAERSELSPSPSLPPVALDLIEVNPSTSTRNLLDYDDHISLSGSIQGSLVTDSSLESLQDLNTSIKDINPPSGIVPTPMPTPAWIRSLSDMEWLTPEPSLKSSVPFSYFDFLELKGLPNLSPSKVKYLEMNGCLHSPCDAQLDTFIRQYFLRVHPWAPVLDEGEFWDLYLHRTRSSMATVPKLSLLVFQAMLFAASAFVPVSVLRACGFQDTHSARTVLHERARLLRDCQTEPDYTNISRASLLLSYHTSPFDFHTNTSQLAIAVQYARASDTHLYFTFPGLTQRQRQEKKRLWWSCLIRDRIIALGVRRHIQITPAHFDCQRLDVTEGDFEDEIGRSDVYNKDAKRHMAKMFMLLCKFAVTTTSTLMMAYPLDGISFPIASSRSSFSSWYDRIAECKSHLDDWTETAKAHTASTYNRSASPGDFDNVCIDVIYIYHFTARIALSHSEVAFLSQNSHSHPNSTHDLDTSKVDLESAMAGLTKRVIMLVKLDRVEMLPISFIAYAALPLVLLSIDVQLSVSEIQRSRRKRRLSFYVRATRAFGARYDYVEEVSNVVRKVLQLVDFASNVACLRTDINTIESYSQEAPHFSNRLKGWVSLLTRDTMQYFRLISTLDNSLSKGKFIHGDTFSTFRPSSSLTPMESATLEDLTNTPKSVSIFSPRFIIPNDVLLEQSRLVHHSDLEPSTLPKPSPDPLSDLFPQANLFIEKEFLGFRECSTGIIPAEFDPIL